MTADGRQRAAGRIRQLARRGLDVAAFWRECNKVLGTAVPHHLAPCWFTFDSQRTSQRLTCTAAGQPTTAPLDPGPYP